MHNKNCTMHHAGRDRAEQRPDMISVRSTVNINIVSR